MFIFPDLPAEERDRVQAVPDRRAEGRGPEGDAGLPAAAEGAREAQGGGDGEVKEAAGGWWERFSLQYQKSLSFKGKRSNVSDTLKSLRRTVGSIRCMTNCVKSLSILAANE